MFHRFYGAETNEAMAEEFQARVTGLGVELSPAQIQGHLLLYKDDPYKAIDTRFDVYFVDERFGLGYWSIGDNTGPHCVLSFGF
ncbi:unnamed protein product [Anisakis simplex]|uniref:SMI1/KNR4 family protein n=1 Tax=Anisakis simplex TaxID=6269 RepID=A0A0M3JFP2_ANISI|nr:unnamed protein product [Anisakis simplex]